MVRKRIYPRREGLNEPPVYGSGIHKLAKHQDEGKEPYGDAVCETEHRIGRAPRFCVGLPPPKGLPLRQGYSRRGVAEVSRTVTYVPPPTVIPNAGEVSDVLNDMTRDLVIPEEEYKLVEEARQLGWSWQRIANELQGRTAKQLMRIMSDPRARPRPRYDARTATPSARLPLQRPAVLSAPLAEILGKRTVPTESTILRSALSQSTTTTRPSAPQRSFQREDGLVNRRTVNRSGGDARVTLHKEMRTASHGFTVAMAHPTVDSASIRFFEELHVVDADDRQRIFKFSLSDPEHCACFNIGEGKDGSPLLSWSNLYAFYELPDGSKWAEHGYLYDREDLESFALRNDKEFMHLIPEDLSPQELIKRKGRFHSRVQNIEYECWIYKDEIPSDHSHEDDDYFYRVTFDPVTMQRVEAVTQKETLL